MKRILQMAMLLVGLASIAFGDVPRGYTSTQEFEEAKAEAIKKKKLLTIVFKGSDDACPNCATTMENGEKAAKSSSVLLFCRITDLRKGETGLPKEILSQVKNLAGGASVYFYAFNPNDLSLVASGGRAELQSDKKKIKAFKDKVRAARKELS